ncbi:MAG: lipoprotein LpqH [Actinomycetia bacterium]|nr:lipoprotein LpqH [Actinomycetes bacterium]MCH9767458.1 lipoprotein LpqH [Actinomycetes bacterium]
MKTRWALNALAAAATLTVAGCSSQPGEYDPPPGAVTAGTAQMTVNGQDAGTTKSVECSTVGPLTTIKTGNQESGVFAMIMAEDAQVVRIVRIQDLSGFTGSYNSGLGGEANVAMIGRTFDISGTAEGFETAEPSFRASGSFQLKVSC